MQKPYVPSPKASTRAVAAIRHRAQRQVYDHDTRATTRTSAIANRLRQIRDRSHPATRARSAGRVARRIYALATSLYLDDHTFTALVDQPL